jgi:ribosome-binding protein aMBF1 (putative translation factor)
MIKNEREYKITKASLAKFEEALAFILQQKEKGLKDPVKLKLQEDAARSMLTDLKDQIQEYTQLRSGKFDLATLDVVEALPSSLIRARIAVGWTQKELATHLGTTEQQIQKYEATNYESASLRKIIEIVAVLKAASDAERSA